MTESEFASALVAELRSYVDAREKSLRDEMNLMLSKAVGAIPAGPKGDQGPKGDAAKVDEDALVNRIVALIPRPKDGKDAEPVDSVALARDVLSLIPVPKDGRDGVATRDELIALVRENVTEAIGPAVTTAMDAYVATLPKTDYRGVYREGETYNHGNFATWAGSLWYANETTTEKPGEGSKSWTLAVKKGRDGRDAGR